MFMFKFLQVLGSAFAMSLGNDYASGERMFYNFTQKFPIRVTSEEKGEPSRMFRAGTVMIDAITDNCNLYTWKRS